MIQEKLGKKHLLFFIFYFFTLVFLFWLSISFVHNAKILLLTISYGFIIILFLVFFSTFIYLNKALLSFYIFFIQCFII